MLSFSLEHNFGNREFKLILLFEETEAQEKYLVHDYTLVIKYS